MQGVATEKVPGGKLLRVKVEYGGIIERVQLTGDFFLHPEEGITHIEAALIGLDKEAEPASIAAAITNAVRANDIQLIGITPEAIAQTIKKAMT